MKRTTLLLILTGVLVLIPLLGWGTCLLARAAERQAFEELLEQAPKDIVASMTLEEKVGQVIHIGMAGKRVNVWRTTPWFMPMGRPNTWRCPA